MRPFPFSAPCRFHPERPRRQNIRVRAARRLSRTPLAANAGLWVILSDVCYCFADPTVRRSLHSSRRGARRTCARFPRPSRHLGRGLPPQCWLRICMLQRSLQGARTPRHRRARERLWIVLEHTAPIRSGRTAWQAICQVNSSICDI
ncbi:hypothetical protein PsYK624_033470 [Phanerochaete sordida]|uniref:Uncharacterized protein n=1 Tax=Phanerochaete sordida TaxID=48140 RepID=A0A9P3LA78_9APHY|nr:hypothetical protein PsYK624_033470 [Phanerochaete sordida]